MTDYLTQTSLLRLLAVMLVVLLPHFWRVPQWEVLLILGVLGWRTLAVLRQWALPRPFIRSLITIAAGAGVFFSYHGLNGQRAGTALLAVMCALKLLEMRSRRDVMITVFLMYFVLLTHFFVSQEMWTMLYLMACAIGITAFLTEVSHASVGTTEPLPVRHTLRLSGFMVVCALPFMVLLFVLFPRIPGPLWGLPADSGTSRTGLSDSMTPGDISELIKSEDPAFRVDFFGQSPQPHQLYWRGPVFDQFDGRTWKPAEQLNHFVPQAEYRGRLLAYEITQEPMRTFWLMALDLPNPKAVPAGAYINNRHHLVSRKRLADRKLYRTSSYLEYGLQTQGLSAYMQQLNLKLPRAGNNGARSLVQNWRGENLNDEQMVQRALEYFRGQDFFYTLNPPKLGTDTVDEFLFETRKGFCEHYSSAFTFMMRAAGIPARVVTGFQGATKNDFGEFYTVYMSDAHAWSEVWLEGRGWVRVDPTAAVAPSRIELGIQEALSERGELPDFMLRSGIYLEALKDRLEWVNGQWNYWVLAYGPELQQSFLSQFGIRDWSDMILALTVVGSLMLAIIGALLLRQYRTPDHVDQALRLWRQAQKQLAKHGIVQRPHEGPRDFARRVGEENPSLQKPMQALLGAYLALRYFGADSAQQVSTLRAAVSQLR